MLSVPISSTSGEPEVSGRIAVAPDTALPPIRPLAPGCRVTRDLLARQLEDAGLRRGRALGQDDVAGGVGAEAVRALLEPEQAGQRQPAAVGLQPRLAILPPLLRPRPGRPRPPGPGTRAPPPPPPPPPEPSSRLMVPSPRRPRVRENPVEVGYPRAHGNAPTRPSASSLPQAAHRDREPDQLRPEHPGDPGGHQGPDARPRRRRASDDLRPRHEEPGAVLAASRPGRR